MLCYTLYAFKLLVTAMEKLEVFTARDLRNRSGELLRDATAGRISLVTKRGKPAFVAVPFDRQMLEYGLHRTMALDLFKSRQITLAQGAKIAAMPIGDFVSLLGAAGIPAVDYPEDELENDLAVASG